MVASTNQQVTIRENCPARSETVTLVSSNYNMPKITLPPPTWKRAIVGPDRVLTPGRRQQPRGKLRGRINHLCRQGLCERFRQRRVRTDFRTIGYGSRTACINHRGGKIFVDGRFAQTGSLGGHVTMPYKFMSRGDGINASNGLQCSPSNELRLLNPAAAGDCGALRVQTNSAD